MMITDSLHESIAFACAVAVVLAGGTLRSVSTGASAATLCDSLEASHLPHTTISAPPIVEAGTFASAVERGYDYKTLPAFCRVQGVIAASSDSHIEFEVWMPAAGWNRKYQGLGNGGFAGEMTYSHTAPALEAADATGATDTG